MRVWKKNSVKYVNNGKRCSKNELGAIKQTIPSKRFYGTLKTFDGTTKQIPLTEDRKTSESLLRRLQSEADHKRSIGYTVQDDKRNKPLTDVLDEYIVYLTAKGNSEEYIRLCESRLRKLFFGGSKKDKMDKTNKTIRRTTKSASRDKTDKTDKTNQRSKENGQKDKTDKTIKRLNDLNVNEVRSSLQQMNLLGISTGTINHYVRAVKCFTGWLLRERYLTSDPFIGLRGQNSKADRRKVRRPITDDEFKRLVSDTQKVCKCYRGNDWHFRSSDRIMLYRLAISTGLRAKEIASLTIHDFDLTTKTVRCKASNTKNGEEAVLPLSDSLCVHLRTYIDQLKTDKLFPGSWAEKRMGGKLLKRDLKRAGIPYETKTGSLDFHSLRYTFISNLAKGNVHPAKAQRLARHSTIALTMDVYTQLDINDLRSAVDVLPTI
ncbi:tyrosine-type recombinase/integrase [Rubinisphaera italica]|uniref:Tyrosine recombinase XerD n=1 Tax=Rubinisphaera italica TaxID=2527969 RepID=A0A5C5XCK9_9PLAN|nr:site-specific integrase [Rubinisphaera italica]TWT59652.1 Tyrosine recombinase XerD [Rubinisphaera italica]